MSRKYTSLESRVGHEKIQAQWCELTKLYWKSCKPTGLSVDFTYITPGRKNKGCACGRDYFVGEEELMKHFGSTRLR
ncbi:Hypothetical protein PHPALM_5856 [Phytophthora palmivora]|uniref:Uncharacterized protein n=1 Tax=Phytophthora palmivora TaxID=4796 RepID=A0A2P4YGB6_9STRA|nr:Hypothetical protein PHPALM_5856 [Phytophthora palmivora]